MTFDEAPRFTEGAVNELIRLHEVCQIEKDARSSKVVARCREEMVEKFERVLAIAMLAVKMSVAIHDHNAARMREDLDQ